jgi:hypothetical protein
MLRIEKELNLLFEKFRNKFQTQKYKEIRLTEYEKAVGFNEQTRKGSKPFANTLGCFIEKLWELSPLTIRKCENKSGIDYENKNYYFQFKSRHDTMKQSQAYSEISPMLLRAINDNKSFLLVVLTDKNNQNRKIPLHKGFGLSKLQKISGYDPTKHLWISGDYTYKFLFPGIGIEVKSYFLKLLSTLKLS